MSATEYRYGYEAGQAGGTRPPNASTDWYRGYDAASATGEMVTYRDVQGKVSEGRHISTHPMTGEYEIMTDKGVAYVNRDRIIVTPEQATERTTAWDAPTNNNTPDVVSPANLRMRTNALQSILEALAHDTDVTTNTDYIHTTESRITMHTPSNHHLSATLKPNTTDIYLAGDDSFDNRWTDILTALNLLHQFITEEAQR